VSIKRHDPDASNTVPWRPRSGRYIIYRFIDLEMFLYIYTCVYIYCHGPNLGFSTSLMETVTARADLWCRWKRCHTSQRLLGVASRPCNASRLYQGKCSLLDGQVQEEVMYSRWRERVFVPHGGGLRGGHSDGGWVQEREVDAFPL